ncbi:FYVE zinc finger domain-containing protein [Lentisphaerota bacterium WC36G]|nr:FYVE zinc finger domain-containing protein [Lentisphaerae bacterium WC36]
MIICQKSFFIEKILHKIYNLTLSDIDNFCRRIYCNEKWQDSASSNKCKTCEKYLEGGFFSSDKVHCRVCGEIVCQDCSSRRARYIPVLEGTPIIHRYPTMMSVPVCDRCFKDPTVLFIDEGCPFGASEEVRKIYDFCKASIIEANRNFPVSASRQKYFGDYDSNLHDTKEDKEEHQAYSWHVLHKYGTEVQGRTGGISAIESTIQHCLKLSIANCYEMSLYCYLKILYATQTANLHVTSYGLYDMPLGDHIFMLIAPIGKIIPSGTSNSDNFENKHSYIIVCDPWRKMIFFLHSMTKYMGMTIFRNIPHYTMNYGDSYRTRYLSMKQLQDSIFKNPHKTFHVPEDEEK